ncbi:MAG: hypothetical protein HN567_00600 [Actinobacteria bacterium]|jgi:hypothetical protein|nr:hypothetical protein [Actinomycetota bacterium]MBT3747230.1 hypothetical protein [Actinomycetota bacterium]MBT3969736.1 hypothetical protein [Actinomycetota bacterium]MBT4009739.1 hypothetical protein [Actinomycetota bacterium]MBT4303788.1 hypothetical protein [Actinomycetota bacterium]
MSDLTEENQKDESSSPPLPHTPPLGIKAVHPGDEPPGLVLPVSPMSNRPSVNWAASLVASLGVVLAVLATFLPWVVARGEFTVEEIGWDQPVDALLVLCFALLAGGVAAALWTAAKGWMVTAILVVAGLAHISMAVIKIFDVASMESTSGYQFSVGLGLPLLAIGGALLVSAALLDRRFWR